MGSSFSQIGCNGMPFYWRVFLIFDFSNSHDPPSDITPTGLTWASNTQVSLWRTTTLRQPQGGNESFITKKFDIDCEAHSHLSKPRERTKRTFWNFRTTWIKAGWGKVYGIWTWEKTVQKKGERSTRYWKQRGKFQQDTWHRILRQS